MAGGLLCGFLVGYLMSAIVDFLQKLWEFHAPSAEAKTLKGRPAAKGGHPLRVRTEIQGPRMTGPDPGMIVVSMCSSIDKK